MGNNLLPADIARYADYIRTDPVCFQSSAEVGGGLGQVAHALFNGSFLRCHVVLRRILRIAAF